MYIFITFQNKNFNLSPNFLNLCLCVCVGGGGGGGKGHGNNLVIVVFFPQMQFTTHHQLIIRPEYIVYPILRRIIIFVSWQIKM